MSEIHDYYAEAKAGWIETYTGGKFHAELPKFDLKDIAYALAKVPRFNGHSGIQFSVAQHSMLVHDVVARRYGYLGRESVLPRYLLEALLHDGTEAYLSDVPAPLKQFFPDMRKMDGGWERALRTQFGLHPEKSEPVQFGDWIALFVEADVHMPNRGMNFVDPHNLRQVALRDYYDLSRQVVERPWREVAEEFYAMLVRSDNAANG